MTLDQLVASWSLWCSVGQVASALLSGASVTARSCRHRLFARRPSRGAGDPAGRTACPRERRVGAIRWPARHGGPDHGRVGTHGACHRSGAPGGLSGQLPLGGHGAVHGRGGCGAVPVTCATPTFASRVRDDPWLSLLKSAPPDDPVRGRSAMAGIPLRGT